jgi:2-dehydropantoate 2-reductase
MTVRIAVLGTGANGSCVAADLTRAGHDTVLIDQWPSHVEAMRTGGLTIQMAEEELRVAVRAHHLCDVCTFNDLFDVVLVMVKAYDTRWACELIKPYLQPDALVVGIQNAMTAVDIADVVGAERTLGCVVELSSQIAAPGRVERNTPPARSWFAVGSFDPRSAGREGEIASLLEHCGRTEISGNILSAKWTKLIVNAMTMGPHALLGLGTRDAIAIPRMREVALRAGSEALAVGHGLGYSIEPVFGLTREDVRNTNRLLEVLYDKIIADVGPNGRATVLYDHDTGRLSEVDWINGAVVEAGARFGIATPVNARIADITRAIHAGEIRHGPANLDRLVEAVET